MNKTQKTFALLTVMVVVVCVLAMAFVGCGEQSKEQTQEKIETLYAFQVVQGRQLNLALGDNITMVNGYPTQTITATISPSTAENQNVTWSVAWGGSQSGNVNEYITVTPSSSGSKTATITCKKGFTGNIIITCTTVQNHLTAECVVTYEGIPTKIELGSNSWNWSGTGDLVVIGQTTYTSPVTLTNGAGTIGSTYTSLQATVTGYGSMVVDGYDPALGGWVGDQHNISMNSIVSKFVEVAYSNGTLTITTKQLPSSYYGSKTKADGGRTTIYTDKYVSLSSDARIEVKLLQPQSGTYKAFNVYFDEAQVSAVTVNKSSITF